MNILGFFLVFGGYVLWGWWGALLVSIAFNIICFWISDKGYSENHSYREQSSTGSQWTGCSHETENEVSYAYKVLGLDEACSNEDVKRAYRSYAKAYHPDRYQSNSTQEKAMATEKFRTATEAYENIKRVRHIV